MRKPDRRLLDMAQNLSDETPVDWSSATRDPENAGVPVKGLELISRVAAVHREHRKSEAPAEILFRWGPLQVVEELGRGSYGVVYRAWDQRLQKEVALKLRTHAEDSSARRWLDEARRLARVQHPNVVRVLGTDVHESQAGIWMELVQGATLASRLDPDQTLSTREATLIGLDMCSALAAVHAAGMVHGDVKPDNVKHDSDGRCVLLDFGSGREQDSDSVPASVTPLYSAPEIIEGQPTSVASDVYALGALLFRLVTGRAPVQAANWETLREAHRDGSGADLRSLRPDLPAAFVSAVDRALRPDPSERHADMAQFERALNAALGVERRNSWWASRWAWPMAAAAVIALLAWGITTRPWQQPGDTFTASGPRGTAIRAEANFFRVNGGSREPLDHGSTIRPGEHLRLELKADQDLHVYVLNEDVDGELFLLFPLHGMAPTNPLAADDLHRLPGSANEESRDWLVTSAGGRERFLVVAASEPLAQFEEVLAAVRPADPTRAVSYPSLHEAEFSILRGVGGMATGEGDPGEWAGSRIAELTNLLERSTLPHGALWYRQIEFLNPRP